MTRLVRCLSSDVSERRDRCDPLYRPAATLRPNLPHPTDDGPVASASVAWLGSSARTQNGHIRNDTHDVSRRSSTACNSPICRRNCVADDRACTRDGKGALLPRKGGGRFPGSAKRGRVSRAARRTRPDSNLAARAEGGTPAACTQPFMERDRLLEAKDVVWVVRLLDLDQALEVLAVVRAAGVLEFRVGEARIDG